MSNMLSNIIHLLIGSGVAADHWLGISEAGNLAIVALWLIILLTFLTVALGVDKAPKKRKHIKTKKYIPRLLFTSNALILFAAGWFISGVFFLIAWALMWVKMVSVTTDDTQAAGE